VQVKLPDMNGDDRPLHLDPNKAYAVGLGVNNEDHKVLVAQLVDCNTRMYTAATALDGGLFGVEQGALRSTPLNLDTKPRTKTGSCPLIYLTAKVELAMDAAP
jgi:hypothetical protein